MTADYFFHHGPPGHVVITKLDDTSRYPEVKYDIDLASRSCNGKWCVHRSSCKHIGMAARWNGDPWFYLDGSSGEWQTLPRLEALKSYLKANNLVNFFKMDTITRS